MQPSDSESGVIREMEQDTDEPIPEKRMDLAELGCGKVTVKMED